MRLEEAEMPDAQRLCTTVRTTCVRLRARNRHHNVPKEIKGYRPKSRAECLQLSKIIRRYRYYLQCMHAVLMASPK